MKKVKMFVVVALLVAISQGASAQEAKRSAADQKKLTHDQLRMAVQEICPVSGKKLGTMGAPVKAKIGKEEVFLCCKGCLKGKVKPEHWATIHANMLKAQAKCPVMNKPLSPKPKWTIVDGQVIYICCPSCAKKIAENPKMYLGKVDAFYVAALKNKRKTAKQRPSTRK
ncbi:MAG: hypothetical protein ACWGMZ_12780 [Thermoguttaceae bacterium]